MWFQALTGFKEESPEQVRSLLTYDGVNICSKVNGKSYRCGELEIASLATLRRKVKSLTQPAGNIAIREQVANVQELHMDSSNQAALFQVASQFNLLEMINPNVTPETGIEIYGLDSTQGPACAIAAAAGTIYRNYLHPMQDQTGQTAEQQIDCLAEMGRALGNNKHCFWRMQNGYVIPSDDGLAEVSRRINALDEVVLDELRGLLQIGIHWNTQVTLGDSDHTVSQAYCSALPVSYSPFSLEQWQPFAKLVLEASYEAVFCAAILNQHLTGKKSIYLTLLGGGAFGNANSWIFHAIKRCLKLFRHFDLDVVIVSYGHPNSEVQDWLLDQVGE